MSEEEKLRLKIEKRKDFIAQKYQLLIGKSFPLKDNPNIIGKVLSVDINRELSPIEMRRSVILNVFFENSLAASPIKCHPKALKLK